MTGQTCERGKLHKAGIDAEPSGLKTLIAQRWGPATDAQPKIQQQQPKQRNSITGIAEPLCPWTQQQPKIQKI